MSYIIVSYSFCYCCSRELLDALTIPISEPSLVYAVFVPRYCCYCALPEGPFFVSKQDYSGKVFHSYDNSQLINNIMKPLTFNEKFIAMKFYVSLNETYHWEVKSSLKKADSTIKVDTCLVRDSIVYDLDFNESKNSIRTIALMNFLPDILNGLNVELQIDYDKTFFFPNAIRKFFGMFFPETCLDFRRFTMQTQIVNKISICTQIN
jgi:hypothetical protein